jgi:hypothetical protein
LNAEQLAVTRAQPRGLGIAAESIGGCETFVSEIDILLCAGNENVHGQIISRKPRKGRHQKRFEFING